MPRTGPSGSWAGRRALADQRGPYPAGLWLVAAPVEEFKISRDPLLIDKIRDVVGLYLAPPATTAIFCVDEKPQIQALERTAPVLPIIPGIPERPASIAPGTHVDLFAALDTATAR